MLSSLLVAAFFTSQVSGIRIIASEVANKVLSTVGEVGCLDPSGNPVDFWYAFKYPGNWQYAYMDSKHQLQTMPGAMGDGKSPVDQTLDQLYKSKAELSYALWNDEPTNKGKVGGPKAHAKGVLAFGKSGFWLTHSVPVFPQVPNHHSSSKSSFSGANQPTNGQSFLCITIGRSAIAELMKLFETDWMVIYAAADNAGLGAEFQQWASKGKHADAKNASADSYVTTVTSLGGQAFTVFSKSAALDDDLYEALVAPHFQKDFIAETWQNGAGKIPPWKKGREHAFTIENDGVVSFPGHEQFKESEDHSKWAVSMDGQVFCVGDINRQVGQTHRGGGTTCISDARYARQILNTIVADEDGEPEPMPVDRHDKVDAPTGRKRKAGDNGDNSHTKKKRGASTEEDNHDVVMALDNEPVAERTRSQKVDTSA